ncbi:MAG: hypothetical protein R3B70_38225 [Polyangiaceae bacterium]
MKFRPLARALVSTTVATLFVATPLVARAQFPGGPGGGGFGGPPQGQSQPKQPAGPETHAASGADDAPKLPTQEPTLPEDPLTLPKGAKKKIGTDFDPDTAEQGRAAETKRRFYGLWYSEESGDYRFRTLFPFWAERNQGSDRASLYTPFYYNRRSKDHDADVAFPLFFRLRNFDTTTTVVGPFGRSVTESRPGSTAGAAHTWFAPFVFHGKRDDGSGYFHIPPLLTFTQYDKKGGLNIAGPLYCKWRGGSACDPRTADSIDLGVAPFYFFGRDETSEYELFPPLLHYYSYSEQGDKSVNVWGPYVRRHDRESDSTWVLPFYYHSWGKNEDSLTVFPLFHKSYKGNESLLVTPLFASAKGEDGSSTFVTWGYARYRGRTELDMITPLYWEYRDPDIQRKRQVLFPFFYRDVSPRNDDLAILPFYGRFERKGVSTQTWVTPLFRHATDITGWETDIFPFFYMGRENQSSHLVIAPFFWDFSSPKSRTTIALPFYFRFEDEESITQLALNTFYREKKGTKEWSMHIFPFVDFGETATGHYWNLFYGLAGYEQKGTTSRMKAFYFPITLSE